MDKYHIAVFDIGKTNKKLLIYDDKLHIKKIERIQIEEYDDGKFIHDNIPAIENWMIQTLKKTAALYNIKVISISTHGATFTCLDENGKLAIPELSYTTDPGDEFHKAFYEEMGSRESLQKETCTPDFNMLLNVAKGIKYVQNIYGDQFNEVKYILNLPQYFSYKLTGVASADPTYVGCHTYLWNFRKNTWSHIVDKLNIRSKLPDQFLMPWDIVGTIKNEIVDYTGLSPETVVTTGIHDSNASLLPHIISSNGNDFILNSTGTWCVLMHEMDHIHFNKDELGKVVFYNLSAFNKPVKTVIFMGGLEFEAYMALLISRDNTDFVFDPVLYQEVIKKKKCFILPGITRGTGQFPESSARVVDGNKVYSYEEIKSGKTRPKFFDDPRKAYAVLNLSLAIQTKVSLERLNMKKGIPIYTEGGFANNEAYNILLGAFYPESDVFLTNLKEATAFGAVLMGKAAIEKSHPASFRDLLTIEKIPVAKIMIEGLDAYCRKFLQLI